LTGGKFIKKKNPNYFPGFFANSEIETIFQIDLFKKFNPAKIISIHAPLGFIDVDYPIKSKIQSHIRNISFKFAKLMSKESENYKFVDYSFFTGSLGNYFGNERSIPTLTLELNSTDVKKIDIYWKKFLPALISAIKFSTNPKMK
jgi:protein MpaA